MKIKKKTNQWLAYNTKNICDDTAILKHKSYSDSNLLTVPSVS